MFSLRPRRLKRYKDIAILAIKYGRKDLIQAADLDQALLEADIRGKKSFEGKPEQLAYDLECLGPTFIKLGQLLSTRPDLLPQPYLSALSRLQDAVEPFAYEEVAAIVSRELGVRLSKAFQTFNPKPIAAASLGQVHLARLRDGRPVAVKVQRPGIRQIILDDFDALDEIASSIDHHTEIGRQYAFRDILDNFRKTLLRELDYRQEAENLITLGENLKDYERIVIPQPIHDYTSSRVLTMDYISGTKITSLSPLARLEHNTHELAEDLFKAYLDQVLVDGFFHADPHPGNVFITDDGKLALIDLGMVASIDPSVQENLLKLLLAISEGRGYDAARISMGIGIRLDNFDEAHFTRGIADVIARYQSTSSEQFQEGRVVMELTRVAAENGVRPASELALLGKTLLHLDEIGRVLEPGFEPYRVLRQHSESILRRRMLKSLSPSHILSSLLETHTLVQKLPDRLNTLLEALAKNEFELRVNALDESRLMENLEKIANRIALGLVLAALIIGAAMMMQVETTVTIFGYPALAIVLFLMAAGCGFALVFSHFLHDGRRGRRPYR